MPPMHQQSSTAGPAYSVENEKSVYNFFKLLMATVQRTCAAALLATYALAMVNFILLSIIEMSLINSITIIATGEVTVSPSSLQATVFGVWRRACAWRVSETKAHMLLVMRMYTVSDAGRANDAHCGDAGAGGDHTCYNDDNDDDDDHHHHHHEI